MFEFFGQVTAQYSNAVLVAVLPMVSDFLERVKLPILTPVAVQQVAEFRCWPVNDGDVGGAIVMTNGLWVWFHEGYVNGFRTPRSYYNLQDPREIPRFYGRLKLSKDEALQLARGVILRLGYTLKETFTDQDPRVDMPPQIGTNIVPHYRFQWKDPVFGGTAVSIEVDAEREIVQEMDLRSPFFRRAPPKIPVESGLPNRQPQITAVVSNEFLAASLPKISEFAKRLALPLARRVPGKQVTSVEFIGSTAQAWLRLTSGYWFVLRDGVVTEFYAPDRVFAGPPAAFDPFPRPLESYMGKWNLSDRDAVELVRKSITRLGYTPVDFYADRSPEVVKHEQVGQYVVPRYWVRWLTNDPGTGTTIAMVMAEVDANKKRLSSIHLLSKRLWAKEGTRVANATTSTNTMPTGLGTNETPIEDVIRYLGRSVGFATNGTNKPVPQAKPKSPFE